MAGYASNSHKLTARSSLGYPQLGTYGATSRLSLA